MAKLEGQIAILESRAEDAARQYVASEKAHEVALAAAEKAVVEAHEARDAARKEASSAREEAARLAGHVAALEAAQRVKDAPDSA